MSDHASLTSLAMLMVNLDEIDQDYLDYLVPFVSHIIAKYNLNPVVADEIRDLLHDNRNFGLDLPVPAVEMVLKRLKRKGFLSRHLGKYYVIENPPSHDIESKRAEANRCIENVLTGLLEFVSSRHGVTWTHQQAEKAVIHYLGKFSIECLRTFAKGTALPAITGTGASELFLVSDYIREIHRVSSNLFSSFIILLSSA